MKKIVLARGQIAIVSDEDYAELSSKKWYLSSRKVTRSENLRNTGLRKDNTSGYKGVRWKKDHKRWVAEIFQDGKATFLGQFEKLEDAVSARQNACV